MRIYERYVEIEGNFDTEANMMAVIPWASILIRRRNVMTGCPCSHIMMHGKNNNQQHVLAEHKRRWEEGSLLRSMCVSVFWRFEYYVIGMKLPSNIGHSSQYTHHNYNSTFQTSSRSIHNITLIITHQIPYPTCLTISWTPNPAANKPNTKASTHSSNHTVNKLVNWAVRAHSILPHPFPPLPSPFYPSPLSHPLPTIICIR